MTDVRQEGTGEPAARALSAPEPVGKEAGPELPLRRNRAYHLLWIGTTSSEVGLNLSNIAFPLLALAATGSPGVAGAVGAVNALAQVAVGLPAGALVDRWDRKKIMLSCLFARMAALGCLTAAVAAGYPAVWLMLMTAAVAGGASSLFDPAEHASLPMVVTRSQLPTALSVNTARMHVGQLVGTSGGGFLFGIGRAVPFLADALAHLIAMVSIWFVDLPARERSRRPMSLIHRDIAAGFGFLWKERFLRTSTLVLLVLNFLFQVLFLVTVVAAERGGAAPGQIGVMAAMFGVGGLLGALVAPRIYHAVSPRRAILGVIWILAVLVPLMALTEEVMVWGLLLAGMSFMAPTAYTVLGTQQILMTPDDMRGRLSSATNLFSGGAQAAGAAGGGLLAQWLTGAQAMLCCAAGLALLALVATAARGLRLPPAVGEQPTGPAGED
ncbi:MFS transporter [Kitasatospora albolonga]